MKKRYENGRMVAPTIVVGATEFRAVAYGNASQYVIHGRKGLGYVPDTAQEIGDNQIVFPEGPKTVTFRKRFSRKTCVRDVRYITADNSRRYDPIFTINLK